MFNLGDLVHHKAGGPLLLIYAFEKPCFGGYKEPQYHCETITKKGKRKTFLFSECQIKLLEQIKE